MAGTIGGGLGGAVGIVAETVYGTFIQPTRTLEVHSSKIQERIHIVQGTGLAFNRSVDLGSRRNNTWTDAGGDIEKEFLSTGEALLLANAMGSAATLAAAGTGAMTNAFVATFAYGIPDVQNYFSLQNLVPDTSGTVHVESFSGGKITKAEWKIERGGVLMSTYTCDFQQYITGQTAFAPTEVTNSYNFDAVGMTFAVGTYGSETALDGVRSCTMTVERELDVERIYIGTAFKDEPITKGVTKLTATMDVDLLSTNITRLWSLYYAQTPVSLVASMVGPQIAATGVNNQVVLNLTNAFIDTNGTPELDGPDIVKATMNFTGLIDASNDTPFKITLTTGDATF